MRNPTQKSLIKINSVIRIKIHINEKEKNEDFIIYNFNRFSFFQS
jgi:hypothetical protein